MASHRLRTPLTIIKGLVSMLSDGVYGDPNTKMLKPLDDTLDSTERLVGIVNDLLDISKADLGKLEIEREESSIEEMITSVVSELEKKAQEGGLEIILEKEGSFKKVSVDPIKIRQVIFNVIDNAIKYSEEGKIEVSLKQDSKKCLVTVKDSGAGMTKEEVEHVFKRFTRGRAGIDKWIQGVGLGLYLAKKYIELHERRIWAESEGVGEGSSFFIEIPV